MSRQIPPMPQEEDRHLMIYSQGNLEPAQPEPPSRSPSPELPPNFVPKPPVESSSFPAANNIISLLSRMSGGASLRDLIIVPAATWDRNNTMWEHKMAQLRKKNRKDWAEKEVDLRRKYDEQYSDARYREMLLTKEMKEMEFAQGVASGEVLGKTWKEHKAAKKDMEKTYIEKLNEAEKKLAESEHTVAELGKKLAEKETVIGALQIAIGGRADRVSTEVQQPQQHQQLQQPQHQQPQHQQPQHQQPQQFQQPQYQMPRPNPNIMATHNQNNSQAPQSSHQTPMQDIQYAPHQHQQQPPQPQVLAQSMAMVRTGANANQFQPRHQDSPHGRPVESRRGGNRGNGFHNSRGDGGHRNASERAPDNNQGRSGQHGPVNNTFANSPAAAMGNVNDQYSYPVPEPQMVALWNNPFPTPQNKSIATKEPPPPHTILHPPPPLQPNTELKTPRPSPFVSLAPDPTPGFKGPFGPLRQAVPPVSFGQVPENLPSAFRNIRDPAERLKGAPEALPFRTGTREKLPENAAQDSSESSETGGVGPSARKIPESYGFSRKRTGESKSQKRRCSVSPPGRYVPSKVKRSRKVGEGQPNPPQSPPRHYAKGVTLNQEEIDKAIDDAVAEYTEPTPVVEEEMISEVDLTNEEGIATDIVRKANQELRGICVQLKSGVSWTGPEYIMNKIRGGLLESVKIYEEDREVIIIFISPTAATEFYNFFNLHPDAKEAFIRFKLLVTWVIEIIPISIDLAEVVANGATRCLKIFQIPNDKLVEDIKTEFSRNRAAYSVLSAHLSTEKSRRKDNGGMGLVLKIEFSSIMLALEMKEKIQSGEMGGYQSCDVEFCDDPCDKKEDKPQTMDSMRTWPI